MISILEQRFAETLLGQLSAPRLAECRAVAIQTIVGAGCVDGVSRELGNSNDSALIIALRSWADVILVGSSTVKAERYIPVRSSPIVVERRLRNGQAAHPPIAVLTESLSLDPETSFFTDAQSAPIIITPHFEGADRSARIAAFRNAGAQIMHMNSSSVGNAIAHLQKLGFHRVLCEGGPTVFSQALSEDAIDVLHLTIDPKVIFPVTGRTFAEIVSESKSEFQLEDHTADADGMLFLRYRRVVPGS